MNNLTALTQLRTCFCEPIPEVYEAARLVEAAADAHMAGQRELVGKLLTEANKPVLRDWLNSIWGSRKYTQHRLTPESVPPLPREQRVPLRMPSVATKLKLHQRDGFHCRCCGIPIMRADVRRFFAKQYPEVLVWGPRHEHQNAAFQALWVQYDHIIPHAIGGTNDFDNLVITCAACNFGRMQYTFAEVGLEHPLAREPVRSPWDGLERLLPLSRYASINRVPSNPADSQEH